MAQTPLLIDVIKKQLKAQNKTYVDVAQKLSLSEASVKRLFAEQNFTLQRLDAIAELLGLEISDLLQLVTRQQQQLSQLSVEQEQEIASNVALLLVTVCVMNGFTYEELLSQYNLSEPECIKLLTTLDKLQLIELLPNNRIKLLIAPNFKWLPRGPIQQFFQHKIQQDFFTSSFDKGTETLMVLNGMLSRESITELQKRMQRLAQDFNNFIREDRALAMSDKIGISLVMAEREWAYSIFEKYQRSSS